MARTTSDENLVPEGVLDQLYAALPEDFVRLRNEQAGALKKAGADDASTAVKKLVRPTVVAWALNQLARQVPEKVDALLLAGRELERAQRRLLSGVDSHGLQPAVKARRKVLHEAEAEATRILEASGRSADPHRAAIAATLQTASAEREAAELLRMGRLERELPPPSGFGNLSGLSLVASAPKTSGKGKRAESDATEKKTGKGRRSASEKAQEAKAAAQREAAEKRRAIALAEREAAEAKRAMSVARQRASATEKRAHVATDNAERLEARAKRARALATQLQDEAKRAATKLSEASERLAALKRQADQS